MLKKIKELIKDNLTIIILSVIFLFIRLPFLDKAFLLRGERDIVLTGFSLAKTGRDLFGHFLPLEFNGLDMATPFLSFYYSALWWLLIPIKNVFFSRLPYALLTVSYVFLVYKIIYIVTKNKNLSCLTSAIFCFSPGIFHVSQIALDFNVATPLLFLGIIYYLEKHRPIAFFLFTLSYFSYNGFRPLIPFLTIYLELFLFFQYNNWKTYIINSTKYVALFLLLFAFSWAVIDGHMMSIRGRDLVFFSYRNITPKILYRRETSTGPKILKRIVNNKLTGTIYYMAQAFVKGQDLDLLFWSGEPTQIYATTFTGQFFFVFLLFFYLGFFYLGKKNKKEYFYLLGLIPVGLVPSVINVDYMSYSLRSVLIFVIYGYLFACGIIYLLDLLKNKRIFQYAIVGIICIFVGFESLLFIYNYTFRRPITMFELFFESEKQLADYLIKSKRHYIILDDSPKNKLTAYILMQKKNINLTKVQKILDKGAPYMLDGFTFENCIKSEDLLAEKKRLKNIIVSYSCTNNETYTMLTLSKKTYKISYKDYSFRTAFFVVNDSI